MSNKYDSIGDFISETAEQVQVAMEQLLKDESLRDFRETMEYAIGGEGKRLRPALTRLVSICLGIDDKSVIEISATCELLHTASLMLDDIQDLDRFRRGKPSTHEMMGIASSSIGAGKLMMLALKLGRKKTINLMDILMDAILKLIEGQGLDTNMRTFNRPKYIKMIELKTGTLFSAAAQIGAILGKANSSQQELISDFGKIFGTAYQMIDDWIDIKKSVLYEEPTGDLTTYKITMPIILLYERHPESHDILTRFIEKKEGSEMELITLFNSEPKYAKCIDDAHSIAKSMCDGAMEKLNKVQFSNTDMVVFFEQYIDYATTRLEKEI